MESHWHPRTWGECLAALSGSSQNPPPPHVPACAHTTAFSGERDRQRLTGARTLQLQTRDPETPGTFSMKGPMVNSFGNA